MACSRVLTNRVVQRALASRIRPRGRHARRLHHQSREKETPRRPTRSEPPETPSGAELLRRPSPASGCLRRHDRFHSLHRLQSRDRRRSSRAVEAAGAVTRGQHRRAAARSLLRRACLSTGSHRPHRGLSAKLVDPPRTGSESVAGGIVLFGPKQSSRRARDAAADYCFRTHAVMKGSRRRADRRGLLVIGPRAAGASARG